MRAMTYLKPAILLVVFWMLSLNAEANWLRVNGLSYNLADSTVTFNVGWSNSWRTTTAPHNWDAAWVFIKFRECGVDPAVPWTHGLIRETGNTYPAQLEPTQADGTPGAIDAAPNNTGVMLRRTSTGVFANAGMHQVTLKLQNSPDPALQWDFKVFGIEMVFIPQGEFYIGDGSDPSPEGHFPRTLITSEDPINLRQGAGFATGVNNPAAGLVIPATFPKGFAPFYCMKYEMSQGQYVDFLNTIPSTAVANRYPGAQTNRYSLNNTGTPPDIYIATRPDRAMNWISWADFSAYLDWAALRPMTDLEFEKICRGPMPPIVSEYAWGSRVIRQGTTISTTLPTENGTEVILPWADGSIPNTNYINDNFTGGDAGVGPLRVGIFAQSTTSNRVESGATYYGVLDMSGNVWEFVVPVSLQNTVTVPHAKKWGDGNIASNGTHDVLPEWPVSTAPNQNPGVNGQNPFVSIKGGGSHANEISLRVSNRYYMYYGGWTARDVNVGGRGLR